MSASLHFAKISLHFPKMQGRRSTLSADLPWPLLPSLECSGAEGGGG